MVKKKEFKRILNCVPSTETEKDWQYEAFVSAGVVRKPRSLPQSLDLREKWWDVGNQEDTGSCVGWAAAEGILRWHFVKSKRLQPNEHLAPRYIWMASKETDADIKSPTTFIEKAGTSIKQALEVVKKYGCVKEEVLPFKSGKMFQGEAQEFYARANTLRIDSYIPLREINLWKPWLASGGPILTRLDVDSSWWNLRTNHSGMLDKYRPPTRQAGHAVAIVGYTSDRFIVRNSWGTDWGDKGFAYASSDYAKEAFRIIWTPNPELEAYGIRIY